MKSKEEFIKRWEAHLAGLALFGLVSESKEGTLQRAGRALDIPAEVRRLLGLMYDYLNQTVPAPPNGAVQQARK